jgi:hypothetical protein
VHLAKLTCYLNNSPTDAPCNNIFSCHDVENLFASCETHQKLPKMESNIICTTHTKGPKRVYKGIILGLLDQH